MAFLLILITPVQPHSTALEKNGLHVLILITPVQPHSTALEKNGLHVILEQKPAPVLARSPFALQ
jgi:hypothetical protein